MIDMLDIIDAEIKKAVDGNISLKLKDTQDKKEIKTQIQIEKKEIPLNK